MYLMTDNTRGIAGWENASEWASRYSQGVKALQGYAIERARFARPLPLVRGFAAIEAHLSALGRAGTALCAAELRSPAPLSKSGFRTFNEGYVEVLKRWNLFRDSLNPVARYPFDPSR